MAWNPDNWGGFYVDGFTAPAASYAFERPGDFWISPPPIAPGLQHTLVITLTSEGDPGPIQFDGEEIQSIEAFYVKVDSPGDHLYGLVTEHEEVNNLGEAAYLRPHRVYLPLVRR